MTEKQYGLIIPSKSKAKTEPKRNIFDEDSDDDAVPDWMKSKTPQKKTGTAKSVQQKEAQKVIKKALQDDPSVYEYDEIYDKMVKDKEDSKILKHSDKSAKYIEQLVKAADRRKMENEERLERQVQKEREAEGEQFQDKEVFVTGAYRKKMEELQRAREEIQRKDMIDEMTDVTKQKDLSGFYRHLYRESNPDGAKVVEDTKVESKSQSSKEQSDNVVEHNKSPTSPPGPVHQSGRKRNVSPRHSRTSPSPTRPVRHKSRSKERSRSRSRSRDRHHRRSHKDKDKHRRTEHRHRRSRSRDKYRDSHRHSRSDRDRSRERDRHLDRSSNQGNLKSDRRNEDDRRKTSRRSRDRDREHKYDKKLDSSSSHGRKRSVSPVLSQRTEREADDSKVIVKPTVKEIVKETVKEVEEEKETKSSVWTKRTVGSVFEDAVERYLRRKAFNSSRPIMVVED